MKSGALNRSSKLKIYESSIRPVVTYGCEAWTLTSRDEQHLRIFERRILRKIFGPVQNEDGSWRIRMNYERNELTENADIVRLIKSRRIAWLGHAMRMDDKRTPKRIQWKPVGTRTRGRPRKRWIAGIVEDMQIMGVRRWRKQCEERTNGRKSLRRLKPTVGCNVSKRRRYTHTIFFLPHPDRQARAQLTPALHRRCVVRRVSGRINGRRREIDKRLQ
jgi:hypothetical protein